MRVHAAPPPGIRQARSRHSLPPALPPPLTPTATDAPPTHAQSPAVTSARAIFPNRARARLPGLCKNYNLHKPAKSRVVSMELTFQQGALLLDQECACLFKESDFGGV